MANIKSAKKRIKQNESKRKINLARKTAIKTAIKKVIEALKSKMANETLVPLMKDAEAKIARARCKGVIPKNTACRKISRLAKKVASLKKTTQTSSAA